MKRKDILSLVFMAILAGFISLLVAKVIFRAADHNTAVPVAMPLNGTFPDVKNDPAYKAFFNTNAIDPTQPIQISNNQNSSPFTGSR